MRPQLTDNMHRELQSHRRNLLGFRGTVDEVMDAGPRANPAQWRRLLGDALYSTAKLYCDYVALMRGLRQFERVALDHGSRERGRLNGLRQSAMRHRLREILDSSREWGEACKIPNAIFSRLGLRTRADCAARISIDLSEIYEESMRTQACIEEFLADRDSEALIEITTGMHHLGSDHAITVIPALEWASGIWP